MLEGGLPRLPMPPEQLLFLNWRLLLLMLLNLLPSVTLILVVSLIGSRGSFVLVPNICLMVRHFTLLRVD